MAENNPTNFEKEMEKQVEQKVTGFVEKNAEKFISNSIEIFLILVFNIGMLIVINAYRDKIPFLNCNFEQIVPAFNVVLSLNIVLALLRMSIRTPGFKNLAEIISNLAFFYLAYQVWTLFPFDTSFFGDPNTWDKIFRGIIVLTVIGVAIGTIVQTGQFLASQFDTKSNA